MTGCHFHDFITKDSAGYHGEMLFLCQKVLCILGFLTLMKTSYCVKDFHMPRSQMWPLPTTRKEDSQCKTQKELIPFVKLTNKLGSGFFSRWAAWPTPWLEPVRDPKVGKAAMFHLISDLQEHRDNEFCHLKPLNFGVISYIAIAKQS